MAIGQSKLKINILITIEVISLIIFFTTFPLIIYCNTIGGCTG